MVIPSQDNHRYNLDIYIYIYICIYIIIYMYISRDISVLGDNI